MHKTLVTTIGAAQTGSIVVAQSGDAFPASKGAELREPNFTLEIRVDGRGKVSVRPKGALMPLFVGHGFRRRPIDSEVELRMNLQHEGAWCIQLGDTRKSLSLVPNRKQLEVIQT